jgi:ankyrin repeat protein
MSEKLPYFRDIVNDAGNSQGWTPLLFAAAKNNQTDIEVIKLLIDNGAEILKPAKLDEMSVLHLAAASNDIHLLDFFLTHLGDDAWQSVNITNSEGWTPMHLACFFSNMDSVNLLLEHGGDLQ